MAKSILSDDSPLSSSRNSSFRDTRDTSPFSRASPTWLMHVVPQTGLCTWCRQVLVFALVPMEMDGKAVS